jgi:hypothetical protein
VDGATFFARGWPEIDVEPAREALIAGRPDCFRTTGSEQLVQNVPRWT